MEEFKAQFAWYSWDPGWR